MPAKVETTPALPGLSPVGGKPVIARFDGGHLSSDGGLLVLREVEQRLATQPFSAPETPELLALGLGQRELAAAQTAGRVVRLSGDVVLLPDGPARAMRVLACLPQPFTTSQARQALGTTRRVAIPLLEHLDAKGWTRRLDGSLREVASRR